METSKQERKALKKAYKKVKRKHILLWKILAFLMALLLVVLTPATMVVSMFDNTMALFTGGTFWELKNEDENAIYYDGDFETEEERVAYGYEVVKQVEAEGAVLLMNENNALPLEKGSNVSCFSNNSVNLVYGGTGSANVDASKANTLKSALELVDVNVNETLWNFYSEGPGSEYVRVTGGLFAGQSGLNEVPWDVYTQDVKDSVAQYGDAAIVVISRVGGEGSDLEFADYNYLELDEREIEMMENVKAMKDAGTVKKIIVLINTSNALEVDFLNEEICGVDYGVDAALWIGGVGISGIDAVAEILVGDVNPSGSLVDTYCYDNYTSPAMQNFTPTVYAGDSESLPARAGYYMIYQEGIYVGYKYYETRYEDYVMGTGNAGTYVYNDIVAYPFGYGLSYTQFEYSEMNTVYNTETDQYEVSVTVTNVGDTYAGKETVQVYVSSPYTQYDIENGVEKASVALVGFGKTQILAPGESETVTVYVDKRDIASYDTYGAGTYILDAGDYYLTCATDAHDAVNNVLAAKGYTSETTEGRMDGAGNVALTYTWNEAELDTTTYATTLNGTEIENQLADVDINLNDALDESIVYLTRNDWTGTFPQGIPTLTVTDQLKEDLQDVVYDPTEYETIEMPTLGADNGVQLYDMIGLDYDDPKWNDLLDQLTYDEMVALIGDAFHWTMPVESVNAPGTRDENGPQGLTVTLFGSSLGVETTALTSEDVMAATFNLDLVEEVGRVVGNDCVDADVAFLYGPGNNIHRTPYSGRNFEYYSEDGFLSGEMAYVENVAIEEYGVKVLMKHYALNDHETERTGIGIWANEQTIREIYLKGFQKPIEEGNVNGVMTSYSRWGTTWTGAHKGAITEILREEWGCEGMVISDNATYDYMDGISGVMAGSSAFDAMLGNAVDSLEQYENDPVAVAAMKEACHYSLYAIANSCAMNGMGEDTIVKAVVPNILMACYVAIGIVLAIFVLSVVMWIRGVGKLRQTEEYKSFKGK